MTSEKKGEGDAGFDALEMLQIKYPEVRRDESITDDYYGIKVNDPYRFLEDPDSEETRAFISGQNKLTEEYLGRNSTREKIEKRMTQVYNYPTHGIPGKRGCRYYTWMKSGSQDQSVCYVQDRLDGESRVFLDPNALSDDGSVSVDFIQFSEDGELVALALSSKGSDWITIKFRNVSNGKDLQEALVDIKLSNIVWTNDGLGIFYARYLKRSRSEEGTETEKYENQKIYYHRIGTEQAEDVLVVEFDDPLLHIGHFALTANGKYLIIFPRKSSAEKMVFFASLEEEKGGIRTKLQVTPIVDKLKNSYDYVGSEGSLIYLLTNDSAPNYRLIGIDLNQPDPAQWKEVVAGHENKNYILGMAKILQPLVLLCYLVDVRMEVEVRLLEDGKTIIQKVPMPFPLAYVDSFDVNKDDHELFFRVVSFLEPGTIYRVDLTNFPFTPQVYKETKVSGYDSSDFVEKQVFYKSKDGTEVPMFIVHKRDLPLNGKASTLLYGYGGYGGNVLPGFRASRTVFLQNFNGVYAVANIRGGGEYGQGWHDGGRLLNKQNSIDDFQAAAEYLIKEGYTSPSRIAINGGSHGGMLVAACVNQRPDLYRAAIIEVGIHDLLRFQNFTIGHLWIAEFGCSDNGDKTTFDNLYRLSPLHNVRLPVNEQVQYPSLLLTTADHDDRVVPLHSYKLIAELQHKIGRSPRQTNPLLIKIQSDQGHDGGKPASKEIAERAEFYAFLVQSAGFVFTP